MARLNEGPAVVAPPTESVEALKRRFVRQNRDLARINTSQSMRIRALEQEQSHLQTENLELREETLRLRHQLSESLDKSAVDELRTQLEARLRAVCDIVAQLGNVGGSTQQSKRIPDPASWRPEVSRLQMAIQEQCMPPIVEDKMFPRRTLGAEEVGALRLSGHSIDSPVLGPPPISHFDDSDPIKFDPSKIELERPTCTEAEEPRDIPAEMALNLETRRRRRETITQLQRSTDSDTDEASTNHNAERVSKSSARRRLSMTEPTEPMSDAANEVFSFKRKTAGISKDSETVIPRTQLVANLSPDLQSPQKERKVLGDKSTNASPRKVVVGKKLLKPAPKAAIHDGAGTESNKPRARRPKAATVSVEEVSSTTKGPEIVDIQLPMTPSAADMFSPGPSEPSSLVREHINNAVTSANLEGMGRPSRRARAIASYAEPSLNTKMRRPTVELVDAVYPSRRQSSADRVSIGGTVVKDELDDNDQAGWTATLSAAEPLSPLSGKHSPLTKPADLVSAKDDTAAQQSKPRTAVREKTARRTSTASRRHSSIAFDVPPSPPSFTRNDSSSPTSLALSGDTDLAVQKVARIERTASRRRSMAV